MFIDYNGLFSSMKGKEKKTCMHFMSLLMNFELVIDCTKKIPSLLNLIVSIVFNNPIGDGKLYLLDLLMKYDKWGQY